MSAVLILSLCFFISFPAVSDETYTLRGRITDALSGQPLASANIWIEGTSRGTVSNRYGEYTLPVKRGIYTIIVSFIGYGSDTTHITIPGYIKHSVSLLPAPVVMPEIVITDEDPAIAIIRKAIENKPIWREKLESYIGNAFTRDKLIVDYEINTISEAYSDIYWHRDHRMREIVTQRRQSANLPEEFQLARMGEIVDFNDDEIELAGFTFTGVTAPNALRYYDYKLTGIRSLNGLEIYDIRVLPKTKLQPLFEGFISVADETYAVMEVDLSPNEAFHMPVIRQLHAHYQQQYRLYHNRFWMPSNFRFEAGFTFALTGFRIADFVYDKSAVIYDYDINIVLHDSIFAAEETFTVAEEAATFDSTFWADHDVLPLTPDEIRAYNRIDSLITYGGERRNRAGRITSVLRSFEYFDGRFNRVEGLYLGGIIELNDLTPHARFFGSLGYGFSDHSWKYSAGTVLYPTANRRVGAGTERFRSTGTIPREQHFGSYVVAAAALFDKNDYLDYYLTDGWRAFLEFNVKSGSRYRRQHTRIEFGFTEQEYISMEKNTDFSLFSRKRSFRENPAITEGRFRGISVNAQRMPSSAFFMMPVGFRWEVSLEHTSPSFTGSDFDFTRLYAYVQGRINTMYRRHALSPVLSYYIATGISAGDVPIQRYFELNSELSGFASVGTLRGVHTKEFGGERFFQFSLEHNFRRIPFLALGIPFLYETGFEFLVHGSIARSWYVDIDRPLSGYLPRTTDGWYTEFGIGIGNIFDLVRIDLTWRGLEPRRFHITFGVSELL
jgi:hypothetical protein